MVTVLQQHRNEIAALCRKYGVRKLELFGSAATGKFDPARSDFDFFVEFLEQGWEGSFRRYMGLKLGLEDMLGQPVDLVEPAAVTNSHFMAIASTATELIYAA